MGAALKAAHPGGFGAVSHLLRGMPQKVPKLTMLITCVSGCTPICRGVIFASLSIDGAPFRVLGGPPQFYRCPATMGNDWGSSCHGYTDRGRVERGIERELYFTAIATPNAIFVS